MVLTAQLFDSIAGLSDGASRKTTVLPVGCRRVPERRDENRVAYGHRAQICRDSGKKAGVWDTIMLRDISVKGVSFLCHEPMSAGQSFVLRLLDKQGQAIRIRCQVTRCEPGGFGQSAFLLGASFLEVIQQVLRVNGEAFDSADKIENGMAVRRVAVARAAFGLLRAIDPIRAVSQWMHKSDDYSSSR